MAAAKPSVLVSYHHKNTAEHTTSTPRWCATMRISGLTYLQGSVDMSWTQLTLTVFMHTHGVLCLVWPWLGWWGISALFLHLSFQQAYLSTFSWPWQKSKSGERRNVPVLLRLRYGTCTLLPLLYSIGQSKCKSRGGEIKITSLLKLQNHMVKSTVEEGMNNVQGH